MSKVSSERHGEASVFTRRTAPGIALLVTRRCNMTCAHCSVESAPRVDSTDPSEQQLLQILEDAARAGVGAVQFTGGEPMMRQKLVLKLMARAHQLGMTSGISTNGYWGKNLRMARTTLRQMLRSGLQYMAVSYDRYHAEFMGPEPVLNLAMAARELGFYFNVNVTRTLHDENLDDYARLFGNLPNVRMRLYDVQPVGRARKFELPELRAETEGFCNAVTQATITEDGRMIACNGPAYFDAPDSPRSIGRLADHSLVELLHRHWDDPVLETIRTFGPAGLRDELKKQPEFAAAFDRRFAGQCDLCHYITGNPAMLAALKTPLTDSKHKAQRLARWAVIRNARGEGVLNRNHVNGPGLVGLFYQWITTGQWPADADRLLGRADVDWDHQAHYLSGSGMAGQLSRSDARQIFNRWAPPYFNDTLQKRATRDALRELSHRDALSQLHRHLGLLGIRGVVLKGAAIYLREQEVGLTPLRVPGDIDLWIENRQDAETFRRHLLENGFRGKADAPRTGPHHLAPVCWQNSPIEIHTGIMPHFWGLPEKEMARDTMPLQDWPYFSTLSPADMLLHEAIHSTTHLYSFGMKLAVDIFRIMRWAERQHIPVDVDQLVRRANATWCRRAFWVPLMALDKGLSHLLPLPENLLMQAPRDEKQRRLVVIAYRRLFSATDDADEMNPFSRNGIFLLLHEGLWPRLRYLSELSRGDAAESRRTAMGSTGGQSWKHLKGHLRNAWLDLKSYRRAIR